MGHATRCVPIINELIKANFEPIIASDGNALLLLQKEFPNLKSFELPSYNIRYSKKGKYLKIKLFFQIPTIISAVKSERKLIAQLIEKEQVEGVISDNRFGVYSSKIPSVYVTHQLNVMSGNTTFLTSYFHQKIIEKFDECWIPDFDFGCNISGELGHIKNAKLKLKYIGLLSRFKFSKREIKRDILVLLSGSEPQRTLLEKKLLKTFKNYKGTVLFVRGVLSKEDKVEVSNNIKVENYLLTKDLEKAIVESEIVISRSGYSTIMDLAVLQKKAYFIPTPGQFEQEYLAKLMSRNKIAPFSSQNEFSLDKLKEVDNFNGFEKISSNKILEMFSLFNGK
ncbi:glycosyltransferase [uncultured Lutibacter sp.]|uniref:glycosyltransferase n=1 Tax=uncultured Lutibacter sp. TaxID=437739 RepID=UPI00262D8A7F|nr:glycosyltransferase [uncultured Lutibacter sp.]